MILTYLLIFSKCIKPFLKKQFYLDFSLIEEIIIFNFIFFICAFLFYKANNNNISDIISKFNKNNIKIIIIYLLLSIFELFIGNILIKQNDNIFKFKIIQKGLYLIITPIIGIFIFNEKCDYNNIIGLGFIILGVYISS